MTEAAGPITEADYVDIPRDARIKALYAYWDKVRGSRAMPARADIDPAAIPRLLPFIVMYNVATDGNFRVQLVGEEIVQFAGVNATGGLAGATMPARAAAMVVKILETVKAERVPKFRAGKAHWQPEKTYRDFEACFLPLSADGETVNIVLSGVSFPG